MELKAVDLYLKELASGRKPLHRVDDADVADYLEQVKQADEAKFVNYLRTLPLNLRAQTVVELPTTFQVDLVGQMDPGDLAELLGVLESDDAADFAKLIARVDKERFEAVFGGLDSEHQRQLQALLGYHENEAGALMQTELLRVHPQESIADMIPRLERLKAKPGIGRIHFAFVTDESGKLVRVLGLDELIVHDPQTRFEAIEAGAHPIFSIQSNESTEKAVEMAQKYDLPVLAVTDQSGRLLGRITHDDVIDWVQRKATEEMYKMAHIAPSEDLHSTTGDTARSRGLWLGINLIGVTLVSMVVGLFEEVLGMIVALAILMPIISNMAGSASVQTITVAIRQMALGELRAGSIWSFVRREIIISAGNGVAFGVLVGAIAQFRFDDWGVSAVIAVAMGLSLLFAGAGGALIPLWFKRMGLDPATTSSVLIITLMDMFAFALFLGLASWWLT